MNKNTKDAVEAGIIRLKRGRWEINTDFHRRQDDGRWSEVHISQRDELQAAYQAGDLNIASNGLASFR